MLNPEDILDPTTAMNMALVLMAKAFKLNYSTLTNNNQRISPNLHNRQIAQPDMNLGQDRQMQMIRVQNVENQVVQNVVQNSGVQNVGNQNGLIVVLGIANQNANQNGNGNVVPARAKGNGNRNNRNQVRCYNCRGMGHLARNCTVRPRRRDVAYLETQLLIAQKEEAGIQLQAEEFDLMAAAGDLDEIEEGTQTDKAPIYDSDGSAEFLVWNNVGGTVEQNFATVEKTCAYFDPFAVYDSKETLQLAQESVLKMKQLNKEIKPTNYEKINKLLEVFVSQKAKSHEELYFSDTSKMASVSKSISIPNEEFRMILL
ncbi:integrase, catalytic region, zinc finger, CCHC-type containing protein [Tanacetum coccineum]